MFSEQNDLEAKGYVLIVDDNPDTLQTLSWFLEDEGYRTQTASNGQEAMALLQKGERPCVVLLDLMMPVMDGWQVISAMRNSEVLSDIPIVVISAFADRIPLQVERILSKPPNLDALLEAVADFCHREDKKCGSAH